MGFVGINCKFVLHKLFQVWRQSRLFQPFIHHFSVNGKKLHSPERHTIELLRACETSYQNVQSAISKSVKIEAL